MQISRFSPNIGTLACLLEEKIVGAATFDKDLFKKLKLDTKATLPLLKPGPLPWIEIMPKYKEAGVPNHRPAYATASSAYQRRGHFSEKLADE